MKTSLNTSVILHQEHRRSRSDGLSRYSAWLGFLSVFCLVSLVQPVRAQGESTGTITGRVLLADTGAYAGNVRISVAGSDRQVFTSPSGEFRLASIPAGEVSLQVSLTGHASQTATVHVDGGQSVFREFVLYREGETEDEFVTLEVFEVISRREYNAQAIALNEQRVSGNLKNVVSTDAYGEIAQGNIGEFLKHVPGVTIEFNGNSSNTTGVQVRGFNSNYTAVTLDGGQLASTVQTNTSNHSRTFGLEQATINNLARIEVVKLPTPDMAANLLGGAVNLVSKSAFERPKAELRYSAYLSAHSDAMSLGTSAGPTDGDHHKVLPSGNFTYMVPLRANLGIVVTGSSANQFNHVVNSVTSRTWSQNGATVTNPQVTGFRSMDSPNQSERNSFGLKLDWKPWDGHLISLSGQANAFTSMTTNHVVSYATGAPAAWGETYTTGGVGRGSVQQGGNAAAGTDYYQKKVGLTQGLHLRYEYEGDLWKVNAAAGTSFSRSRARDTDNGFFGSYLATLSGASQVSFVDFSNSSSSPGEITVLNASGSPVDLTDADNYLLQSVSSMRISNRDSVRSMKADIARDLDTSVGRVSLKAGVDYNTLRRVLDYSREEWSFVGADGVANTSDDAISNYLDDSYSTVNPGRGYPTIPYASPWKLHDLYESTPSAFVQTGRQAADRVRYEAIRATTLEEDVSSGFFMVDGRFLDNRLRLIAGARYEHTKDEGWGYLQDVDNLYQRDTSGEFIRDGSGNRVLKAEALGDATGRLNAGSAALMYQKRGNRDSRTYDGTYPSVHASYNITDNLLFRAAYAKTLGRPPLKDVVPNIYISTNENSSDAALGYITASNSTLKPWEADNVDLSIEYYLPRNGVLSAGVFRKDIKNFFGNYTVAATSELLESIGLSDDYLGYQYTTRINVGDARIDGIEIGYSQSLGFLGPWAENLSTFANYTRLSLDGSRTADFADFIPTTANFGFRAGIGRLTTAAKWNYRGRQRRESKSDFANAAEFIRARATVDLEVSWLVSEKLSVFATAVNIFKEPYEWEVAGPVAPRWSSLTSSYKQGAQFTLGVRGSF